MLLPSEILFWLPVIAQNQHPEPIDHGTSHQINLRRNRLEILLTAYQIHNDGLPQSEPSLTVCLNADRLELARVGVTTIPPILPTNKNQQEIFSYE